MSWPQHMGDLILPWPSGHWEMWTVDPSGLVRELCSSSLPHLPQVIVPTLMPHLSQVYAATLDLLEVKQGPGWVPRIFPGRDAPVKAFPGGTLRS